MTLYTSSVPCVGCVDTCNRIYIDKHFEVKEVIRDYTIFPPSCLHAFISLQRNTLTVKTLIISGAHVPWKNIFQENKYRGNIVAKGANSKMRGLYLSSTLTLVFLARVNGHIDSDGYETFTMSSSRTVINSFKVFEEPTNWNDAHKKCLAEGAHLVYDPLGERSDVLKVLSKKLAALPRQFHVGYAGQGEGGLQGFVPRHLQKCFRFGWSGECDIRSPFVCEKEIADDQPGLDPRLRN